MPTGTAQFPYTYDGSLIAVHDFGDAISLPQTLDCGQAFRWRPADGREGWWEGAAMGRVLRLGISGGDLLMETTPEDYEGIWRSYFDMDRDYDGIKEILSADETMCAACGAYPGIRLLRQDPWETVCSFIISANNNIARIKGIIGRLCDGWGEPIAGGWRDFPRPEVLAVLEAEDLAPLRAGYRADYLVQTARVVAGGQVDLDAVRDMDDQAAYKALLALKGVGPKVADCILLFAYGRLRRVPVDVWIRRVLASLYPGGLPDFVLPYAGVAQQFLFHYARNVLRFE